jgi:hypothetical protein
MVFWLVRLHLTNTPERGHHTQRNGFQRQKKSEDGLPDIETARNRFQGKGRDRLMGGGGDREKERVWFQKEEDRDRFMGRERERERQRPVSDKGNLKKEIDRGGERKSVRQTDILVSEIDRERERAREREMKRQRELETDEWKEREFP